MSSSQLSGSFDNYYKLVKLSPFNRYGEKLSFVESPCCSVGSGSRHSYISSQRSESNHHKKFQFHGNIIDFIYKAADWKNRVLNNIKNKMDLQKHCQEANTGSYIPHTYGTNFFSLPHFSGVGAPFHFVKDGGNMPFKCFSYPNCYSSFKISTENLMDQAINFTNRMRNEEKLSATMNLSCIVDGFVGRYQKIMVDQRGINNLENVWNIVSKSVEINRTMSCPSAFNLNGYTSKSSSKMEKPQSDIETSVNKVVDVKMSYADVAKMNLSNINSRYSLNETKNKVSSQKLNSKTCGKKEYKIISPPHNRTVNRNNSCKNRFGTNSLLQKAEKDCIKPKFIPSSKHLTSKKPLHKRAHSSYKRELGTKRNNQSVDLDGSVWSRENMDKDTYENAECCSDGPSILSRTRSISSESDCSSEFSDNLKNPRVRSISECSINSIESEDSFIVFDDCTDDKVNYDSYEDESSSDEESEILLISGSCSELPQAAYLQSVNSKWNTLPSNGLKLKRSSVDNASCKPCNILKKVRFACGEAFAKVRKLCVWDYAHRAARVGPWEQAARDRARFSSRISSLSTILNPVLDPCHRSKIYDMRFAPR